MRADNLEKAIVCDPEDGTRWTNLAISILNSGYVRDSSGQITRQVPRRVRLMFAFPLILRALQDLNRQGILRPRVITVLIRADALPEATAISEGVEARGEYDTAALAYIEDQISKSN